MSGQAKFSCMCVHTCIIQAGRDHANRHLRACLRAPDKKKKKEYNEHGAGVDQAICRLRGHGTNH